MKSPWFDTQTNAILQGIDPPKFAPSLDAEYSLVLLDRGQNPELERRALARILDPEKHESITGLLEKPCPFVIQSSITYGDAALGQFEFICANSVSVIVRDEVAFDGDADYLQNLFQSLRKGDEFQVVTITLMNIPTDERGRHFCDQFLGGVKLFPPLTFPATRKKARMMQHWAQKIGAEVEFAAEK